MMDNKQENLLIGFQDEMIVNKHKAMNKQETEVTPVDMICINDVPEIPVNWLWYPYIPFGKLTAVLGNPGEGKTYMMTNVIAACTNHLLLPGMKKPIEPFNVIYQTAEDGLGDTVKPRLIEAGADLTRVFSIDDTNELLTLSDERVERAILENHARLCVFDPLQAFLGANVDMNRANEVRPILSRLGKIAEQTGCAIVFIGHLNKAASMQSLQRGLGSIDIVAAMRSVMVVGKLKKDPSVRILAHEKSSLAPNGNSLAFSLEEENGFIWIGEYQITADDLLAGTEAKRETKTEAAIALIRKELAGGKTITCAELDRMALEKGIPGRTIREARKVMGDELIGTYDEHHTRIFRLSA